MLQVQTFVLPGQQTEANEFLKTHAPEGPINFNRDMIVVFYDDGVAHPSQAIADLRELLKSNANAKFQMEVALHVMKKDLAGLNPLKNKGRYEECFNAIRQTEEKIADQDTKAAFVQSRIDELTK